MLGAYVPILVMMILAAVIADALINRRLQQALRLRRGRLVGEATSSEAAQPQIPAPKVTKDIPLMTARIGATGSAGSRNLSASTVRNPP